MSTDQRWTLLESGECGAQRHIALVSGDEEPIMRGDLAGCFPDTLHRHEFRRVGRQTMQLDLVAVGPQPSLAVVVEPVTWGVVDDQKDLAASIPLDQQSQEIVECVPIEHRRKLACEAGIIEGHSAVDVGRFAQPVGIDTGLNTDAGPSSVQAAILPETGLVLEYYDPTARGGFFLIRGSRSRSQTACSWASARASRLRGRCTEKPNWCSSRGT